MLRFLIRRLGNGALTLAALVTLTFFVMRLAPGGPFSRSRHMSEEMLAMIEARYNSDQPLIVQFGQYVSGLMRLDFGPSMRFRGYSVGDMLATVLPCSLTVGVWATLLATSIGIALGVAGAMRRNGFTDYAAGLVGVTGIAIPILVIAPLMQVQFALRLDWLPVGSWNDGWRSLVLPVLALSLPNIAYISRLTRTGRIETLRENHIGTARSKGIGARAVV